MNPAGYHPPSPYGQPPYPPAQPPGYAPFPPAFPPPPPRRGMPRWGWVLIILGGGIALSCAGLLGLLAYIGSVGPDTKVYTSNEVPQRFVDVAKELKLLDAGEQVKFFYSDAIKDVRQGMYFTTDKKVVVYIAAAATPKTVVPYEKIRDASLDPSTSFFEDGTITLTLDDGGVVSFPVSGEGKRDRVMFDAIEAARKAARGKSAGKR